MTSDTLYARKDYKALRNQEALAALIKNTKTQRRSLSLTEIANYLDVAITSLGSIKEAAERIGLSTKMLRQFQYVRRLSTPVQKLFAERQLDSVDAAVHLSFLSAEDQITVAEEIINNQLDSTDVRAVVDLRRRQRKLRIEKLISRIKATKDVKKYSAEFVVRSRDTTPMLLRRRFARIIGKENIYSLGVKGSAGRIEISDRGRTRLQRAANAKGKTKAQMVGSIVNGDED